MAFFKNLWTFLTETIFLKDERNYRNGLIRWGVRQYKLLFYTASSPWSRGSGWPTD